MLDLEDKTTGELLFVASIDEATFAADGDLPGEFLGCARDVATSSDTVSVSIRIP